MKTDSINYFVEIPLEDVQTEKGRMSQCKKGVCCLICGKEIKDGTPYKTVHLLTNGNLLSYSGDDVDNSQGFFPVGNECAKKLVIRFAF